MLGFFQKFKNIFKGQSYSEVPSVTPRKANAKNSTVDQSIENEINPILLKELKNGLLPGEVLLMYWLEGNNLNSNPPGYFKYTYGINAKVAAKKLVENGYLTESSPGEAIKTLKVAELKEILKEHNLKLSGNKATLIERITENLTEDEIVKYIDEKPLQITDKGEKTLKEYYYIVPAHRFSSKDGVYNVAEAIKYFNEFKGNYNPPNGDISWALLQKSYLRNLQNGDYGLARNNILSMAEQLNREKKLKSSLLHYVEVFVMDMSGLSNNNRLHPPKLVIIAPGIVNSIKFLKDNFSEGEFIEIYENAWSSTRQSLPFHYLTKEECYECLKKAINGDEGYVEDKIEAAFNRINKK